MPFARPTRSAHAELREQERRILAAGLAGTISRRGADSPEARARRREYHAVALANHMRDVDEAVGPLTPDQGADLVNLIVALWGRDEDSVARPA